jgi:hypothetical protein
MSLTANTKRWWYVLAALVTVVLLASLLAFQFGLFHVAPLFPHKLSASGYPCFQTWGGKRRSLLGAGAQGQPVPLDKLALYMIYFLHGKNDRCATEAHARAGTHPQGDP